LVKFARQYMYSLCAELLVYFQNSTLSPKVICRRLCPFSPVIEPKAVLCHCRVRRAESDEERQVEVVQADGAGEAEAR
jgi:hypothetical protein